MNRKKLLSIGLGLALLATAATAANVRQYFPASVGRSPTILPVCPLMAKRKLLPFQRVESIHTGSSA